VNATFLLLSSVWITGADATPAPVMPMPAAPVVVGSAGCGGCGAAAPSYSNYSSYSSGSCDNSCSSGPRMGLFSRMKSKLHCSKSSSCAPSCAAPVSAPAPVACAPVHEACAPSCGTPMFTGFTTSSCDTGKHGLCARLHGKFKHSGGSCDSCTSSSYGPSSYGTSSGWNGAPSTGCSTGPAMVAPANPAMPPREMPPPTKEDVKPKTTQATDGLRIPELGGTAGKY